MLDWDHEDVRAWLESNGWIDYFEGLGKPLGKHLAGASHETIKRATKDEVTGEPNMTVAEYMFNEITGVLVQNLDDYPDRQTVLHAKISARGESSSGCHLKPAPHFMCLAQSEATPQCSHVNSRRCARLRHCVSITAL